MDARRINARAGAALVVSAIAHLALLWLLFNQASTVYELPEPPSPPMEVELERLAPVEIPVLAAPRPRIATPPTTPPPVETTAMEAPTPRVPRPAPAPSPTPAPTPAAAPPPAQATTPVPVQAYAKPAPMILHKPKKEAPLDVPTLPLAPPAASPAAAPPASSSGGAAAGASGGSPTGALTPYPGGAASLGRGGGLRGSLLGCANAEAVGLSPEERARCNERFGEDLAHAPVLDGIDPAKRAAFGAAAARAERDHERDEAIAKSRDTSKPSDPGGIAHGAGSALVFPHNVWDPVVPGDPH